MRLKALLAAAAVAAAAVATALFLGSQPPDWKALAEGSAPNIIASSIRVREVAHVGQDSTCAVFTASTRRGRVPGESRKGPAYSAGRGFGIAIRAGSYEVSSFSWPSGAELDVTWAGGEPPQVYYGYDFSGRGRDLLIRWSDGRTSRMKLTSHAFVLRAARRAVMSISALAPSGAVIGTWNR